MRKWKLTLKTVLILALSLIVNSLLVAGPNSSGFAINNISINNKIFKEENKETVDFQESELLNKLAENDFELSLENSYLALYLKKGNNNFNIAIHDKSNGYVWFGYPLDYQEKLMVGQSNYSPSNKRFIESGVTIEYFDSTSEQLAEISSKNGDVALSLNYQLNEEELMVLLNYQEIGISFVVSMSLEKGSFNVRIPVESIKEVPYLEPGFIAPKEHKLKNIILFPYFGAENYQINGYSLIVDGPGALIRYQDVPHNSVYQKRLYERDLGIQSEITSQSHLKPEKKLNTPIYGVNHGYHQAAFLAELNSGYGASYLNSYPYGYNNIALNTTFFTYGVRDKILIELSGGSTNKINLINKDPYPFDYLVKYSFLQHEKADYVGMAKLYQEHLNLSKNENLKYDLNLEVIGLDTKPYLFGKKTVVLTTYQQLEKILTKLNDAGVNVFANYKSYTKGGSFGENGYQFNLSHKLGGNKGFKSLVNKTAELNNVSLSIESIPLLVANDSIFEKKVKKINLDIFKYKLDASYLEYGNLLEVNKIASRVLKNKNKYQKYQLKNINLKSVGEILYSYQVGNKTIYREEMILNLKEELNSLSEYSLGLTKPASFAYQYLDRYYEASYEANSYSYITDYVPFTSLVLSGSLNMYSELLNYVSDLNLVTLKMIEYNLKPSFVVTDNESHNLRYTNYEYLFSTEFSLWEKTIKETYQNLESYLKPVSNELMLNHQFISDGVSKVTYETYVIYINYNNNDVMVEGVLVPGLDAVIVGGDL